MRTSSGARRRVFATVAVVAVAVGIGGCSSGTPFVKPPKPVQGKSLRPLVVYQRTSPTLATTPHPKIGRGERALPPIRGINPVIVKRKPVISLHVEYARVAPFGGGGWRIALLVQEGSFFNGATMGAPADVTVIGGKATFLFPMYEVNGPPVTAADEPQFMLGLQWATEATALAVARSFTTSVTVAHCTQKQIDKYRCE
ncbi:MAG: hypothetical protein ACTHK4_11280 [Mycobacteriales bacterium]